MVPGPLASCQLSRAMVFWISLISCCCIEVLVRLTDQRGSLVLAGSEPALDAPGEDIDPFGVFVGCPPGRPDPPWPPEARWAPGCWASSWCWKSMHAGVE